MTRPMIKTLDEPESDSWSRSAIPQNPNTNPKKWWFVTENMQFFTTTTRFQTFLKTWQYENIPKRELTSSRLWWGWNPICMMSCEQCLSDMYSKPLTPLSLHPLALQLADVQPLLRVLVPDVLSGSQWFQGVPGRLDVPSRANCSLVLHHFWGESKEE